MPIELCRMSLTSARVPHGTLASRKVTLPAGTTGAVGTFEVLQRKARGLPSMGRPSSSLRSERRDR